nr:replication initiation factor domain-containing protein [Enterococcus cecorum]
MLLNNLSDKRFYRIDLAIDCYFNLLQSDIINKRVSDKITYTKRDKVTSLYFGKQSSGKVTVFYDKKLESPRKYSDYDIVHRLEIRLYSTQANNLVYTDFSKLLSSFSITKLDINDSLSLQKKALTTMQKLQVKEYINSLYGVEFTKQEKYRIKQLISKLRKTDYKPVFDEILKQSESTIKEQLQGFISDIVAFKAVA